MKFKQIKNRFIYKQYTYTVTEDNLFKLEAFENLDIIDLGEFKTLDELKKFIRKKDKDQRDKLKCTICGYLKSDHKAVGGNCPYNKSQHTIFLKTVFTSKK